ncbi:MAG TPA: phosphomannomutase [Candidatus Competibacteraceae bacterium]|nr:phosphomannomutase [Candidatus Competibacteraceae bacterium]
MNELTCFKAYDIRGRIPDELNENLAYRIGRAYAIFLRPRRVAVGHDVRLSSPALSAALTSGLLDGGADVLDIGLCGTEEIYFATFDHRLDGGIMVTASHNPMDYNGMKLVREQAKPISGDNDLFAIRDLAAADDEFTITHRRGTLIQRPDKSDYLRHLLGYIDPHVLRPLKIVVNAGNGGAGSIIDGLEPYLPFQFIKIHHEPDGTFPHGIPNPLLPECRNATAEAVREHGADLGLAWDGDFDRCFFFDETGRFIEGYYLVGLLAETLLMRHPGSKIIHDPRLTWNTLSQVRSAGGIPVQSKTGHAFIKERMRKEDAIYGGEMSAHHYFREFAYCDSGMIPWLLIAELVSQRHVPLSALVNVRMRAFPCSGEINFQAADAHATIEKIRAAYANQQPMVDETDGLSLEFADWRFNVRSSNTEPLLRLNVETRGDAELLERRVQELQALMSE